MEEAREETEVIDRRVSRKGIRKRTLLFIRRFRRKKYQRKDHECVDRQSRDLTSGIGCFTTFDHVVMIVEVVVCNVSVNMKTQLLSS